MDYRIKEILKEKKTSITELANLVGIQRETLSRIINGAGTSTDTLEKIASALDVKVLDLLKENVPDTNTITCPNCGKRFKMED